MIGGVSVVILLTGFGATSTDLDSVYESLTAPAVPYDLHAIRVGTSATALRRLFIADDASPKRIRIAFAFWMIRGGGRTILVDTGFSSPAAAKGWDVENFLDPVTALSRAGVRPEDVTDVIVTHLHWDHVGALFSYEAARIWITERELTGLRSAWRGRTKRLASLDKAKREGRLNARSGIMEVTPSVAVVPVGLHTPGFSYVVLKNSDGPWVFASDIGPLRLNFETLSPTGQASHRQRAQGVLKDILAIVEGDLSRIVPGHEPLFGASPVFNLANR